MNHKNQLQSSQNSLLTVYAIHDFQAENPDELSFSAGEAIAVTEKDDQYGDGWWQGWNTKGAFGLFPQAYTSLLPISPSVDASEQAETLVKLQPSMNETLFEVQHAIEQLQRPPSSAASLTGGPTLSTHPSNPYSVPSNASSGALAQASIRSTHPQHSDEEDDRSLTLPGSNNHAAKTRAALAEKTKANAAAHQLLMDRLNSAPKQLYSAPQSASSSRVSIPELSDIDLSEESGEDDDSRLELHSQGSPRDPHRQRKGPLRSQSSGPRGPIHTALDPSMITDHRPTPAKAHSHHHPRSEDGHDSAVFNSGPFSAAAMALGLAHTPTSAPPNATFSNIHHSRNQSVPYQAHKPKQQSSSSILSDIGFGLRDLGTTSSPLASVLRMSRESSQHTQQPHTSSHGDRDHPSSPSFSKPESTLMSRPVSQDKTPTPNPVSTFTAPTSTPAPNLSSSSGLINKKSDGSPQEHLIKFDGLVPSSLEAPSRRDDLHQRQRSASSVSSSVFVRPQVASPLHPQSPSFSAGPPVSSNHPMAAHTSNSTADSSSAQGSRSRSSSRLERSAGLEDQLTSPATSTFPSISGKTRGAGSSSSIGGLGLMNGLEIKSRVSDPTDWTVADVMEWGKAKGFDEFTISKFSEHEITGDVLMELDMNSLKEIDLIAFGRRVKVTKAIEELRKTLINPKQDTSSPSPRLDSSQSYSPVEPPTSHAYATNAYAHQRSQSTSTSHAGLVGFRTPDLTVHGARQMVAEQPEESEPQAEMIRSTRLSNSDNKGSFSNSANDSKKAAAVSFAGFNRKHEPDLDGSPSRRLYSKSQDHNHSNSVSSSLDGIRAPQAANHRMGIDKRPESLNSCNTSWPLALGPDVSEKDELVDAFDPMSIESPEVEPVINQKLAKRKQRQSAQPKPPGTGNSLLGKKSFHSNEGAVDPPSSPETPHRPDHGGGKSRTSFLGNLRGRKPPPKLSSTSAHSPPQGSSHSPSTGSTEQGNGHGRIGRGIFHFGHHPVQGQPQHQISHVTPISDPKAQISLPSPLMEKDAHSKSAPPSSLNDPTVSLSAPKGSEQKTALERIGTPDHVGWMRKKGEKYPTWKMRYFILKNANLYYLKSENEARIKGLIKLAGFKVVMDDDVNPGRYGFKIIHDNGASHAFSADDSKLLRDWMKAMMKATIDRDWLAPVISSCNIHTIPIGEAQSMFPPPRPPSPTSRARAQKARLAANPEMLNAKDASMLLNMQRFQGGIVQPVNSPPQSPAHVLQGLRPKKSVHRQMPEPLRSPPNSAAFKPTMSDQILLNWINSNLPRDCEEQAYDFSSSIRSGKVVVRLIENLTGRRSGLGNELFEKTGGVGGGDVFDDVDVYFGIFDFLNSQRIPLEGYSLNDMISGEPAKTREFLSRIYSHFKQTNLN